MEEVSLATHIKMLKEFNRKNALDKILIKMQPLVMKYVRKLYFMEKEDATQELNLALIESVYRIKKYDNEAMCLTYIQKSIINKYFNLCKLNFKFSRMNNEVIELKDDIPYNENFNDIELTIDMYELLKDKNDKQKDIIKYILINELSDKEISLKMNISRQYVNRVKKEIFKEYFNFQKLE